MYGMKSNEDCTSIKELYLLKREEDEKSFKGDINVILESLIKKINKK